jgi:hypothetical protein
VSHLSKYLLIKWLIFAAFVAAIAVLRHLIPQAADFVFGLLAGYVASRTGSAVGRRIAPEGADR